MDNLPSDNEFELGSVAGHLESYMAGGPARPPQEAWAELLGAADTKIHEMLERWCEKASHDDSWSIVMKVSPREDSPGFFDMSLNVVAGEESSSDDRILTGAILLVLARYVQLLDIKNVTPIHMTLRRAVGSLALLLYLAEIADASKAKSKPTEKTRVIVEVMDGLAEIDVVAGPRADDLTVELRDYDVEGVEEDALEEDADGETFFVADEFGPVPDHLEPNVIITIHGGLVSSVDKPDDVIVEIRDYDLDSYQEDDQVEIVDEDYVRIIHE